jgi:hypothetical protein
MRLQNDTATGIGATSLLAFEPSRAWTLSGAGAETATKAVYLELVDAAGNRSTISSDDIAFDNEAPVLSAVTVNGGTTPTNERTLTVALTTSGSPTEMRVSEDAAFAGATWTSFAANFAHTFSSNDGAKTLYVQVRDDANNTSTTQNGSVTIDTTGPSLTVAQINAGAAYAASLDVTVTTTAGGSPSRLVITEDSSTLFDGAYAASKELTLAAGEGPRTLGVRVYDALGNASDLRTATIVVDTVKPTGSIVIAGGALTSTSRTVTLSLGGADGNSGIAGVKLANTSGALATTNVVDFEATKVWTLSGSGTESATKTVYLQVIDGAGNVSATYTDTIDLDNEGPTLTSVTIAAGASITSDRSVSVSLVATGADEMLVSQDAAFAGATWRSFATTFDWNLEGADGTKTLYVRLKDSAGNFSSTSGDTIDLDTTPPALSAVVIDGGAAWSQDLDVSVASTTSGTPTTMRISEGATVIYTGDYAATTTVTLAAGEGARTLTVRVWDAVGLASDSVFDTISVDTAAPSGLAVSIQEGSHTTDPAITVLLSASGADEVAIQESADFSGATYEAYATQKAFVLSGGDGLKTIYVQVRDAAGWTNGPVSVDVTLDESGPTAGGTPIVIAGGASGTSVRTVTLTIDGGDADEMQVSESSTFAGASWEAISASRAFELSAGDGVKTVYVRFRDTAGNTTGSYDDTIALDTTPPTGATLAIVGNPSAVSTTTVSLTLGATGASTVELANNLAFTGAVSFAYTTATSTTISSGDGVKNIYARFCDAASNCSAGVGVSVILDTTAPSGGLLINNGAAATTSRSATLTISGSDTGSGLAGMRLQNDTATGIGATSLLAFEPSRAWTLSGAGAETATKTVYLELVDAAGNRSTISSDAIAFDNEAPVLSAVVVNGGTTPTNDRTLTVALTTSGSPTEMRVSEDAAFAGATWTSFAANFAHTFSSTDGAKTLYVQVRDDAHNTSTTQNGTVTIDTTGPSLTVAQINAGAAYAASLDVTVTTTAGGSPSRLVITEDSSTLFDGAYAASKGLTLAAGEGPRTLGVRVYDALGNASDLRTPTIIVDSTAPTGSISINSGATTTSNRTVSLNLSGADGGSGLAGIKLANTSGALATTNVVDFEATKVWTLSGSGAETATKTVYLQVIDGAGNVSATYSDSIEFDNEAPVVSAVTLNGGTSPTADATVSVAIWASGSPTEMRVSENAAFAGAAWAPFTTPISHTTSSGDGLKTVYVQARDAAGNTSGVQSGTVVIDTAGPAISSVQINSGAEYTNNLTVSVAVAASGTPTRLVISENASVLYDGAYGTPQAVVLAAGDGPRALDVRLYDALGNAGELRTATIDVDTALPTGSVLIAAGAARVPAESVTLNLAALDSGSGIKQIYLAHTLAGLAAATPTSFDQTKAWTLSAVAAGSTLTRTVWYQVEDDAGNRSAAASDSILVDKTIPTGTITPAVSRTNNTLVGLDFTAVADAESMKISAGGACAGGTWAPVASSTVWSLSSTDGAQQVSVRFRDEVGNESICYSATITLDMTGPTPTSLALAGSGTPQPGYSDTADVTATFATASADCATAEFSEDVGFLVVTDTHAVCSDSLPYTFAAAGDGAKSLYLRYVDDLGNVGPLAEAAIIVDSAAPQVGVGGAFAIAEGWYVQSTAITLQMNGIGATRMRVAQAATCTGTLETYSAQRPWMLGAGDGAKTMAVRFEDEAGNATSCYTRQVTLDTVNPVVTIAVLGAEGSTTRTANEVVTLTLTGYSGDAIDMMISNTAGFAGSSWQPLSTPIPWQLLAGDGAKTVYVKVRDRAGRESGVVTRTITLDQTPPDAPFIGLSDIDSPADGYALSHNDVELAWTNPGDPNVTGFQLQRLVSDVDSSYVQIATPGSATFTHRDTGLTELGRAHNYRIRAVDNLGLSSPWSNVAVARPITAVAEGVLVFGGGQQMLTMRERDGVVGLAGASRFMRESGETNTAAYPSNQYVWYRDTPFTTERIYNEVLDLQSSNADGSLVYNARMVMPQNQISQLAAGTDLKLMGSKGLANDDVGALHACYLRGGDLTYGTNRSGQWVEVVIEAANAIDGCAIIANGTYAFVVYRDATVDNAVFWRRTHSDGTVIGATVRSTVDDDGYSPTLALVGTSVYVMHRDATNTRLRVNYATTNGAGTWGTSSAEAAIHTAVGVANYGGNPHLLYDGTYWHLAMQDTTNNRIVYLRGTSASAWSAPVAVVAGGFLPFMAVSPDQAVHVSFQKSSALQYVVGSATSFGTPEVLRSAPSLGDSGTYSAVALDLFGQPMVVAYNLDIEAPGVSIHLKSNTETGWIEQKLPGANMLSEGIGLALVGEFKFAVLFEGMGGNLQVAEVLRTNSSTRVRSSTGNTHGLDADVVVGADGRTHACSRSSGDLWYSRSAPTGWESYLVEAGATARDCAIAVTSGGTVHIAYQAGSTLKHATGAGASWTLTTVDASGTTGYNPRLHLDSAENLHVCYLSTSLQRIRYARLPAAGAWESPLTRSAVNSGGCRVGTWGSNYPYVIFDDVAGGRTVMRRSSNAQFTGVYAYVTLAENTTVGGLVTAADGTLQMLMNRSDGGLELLSGPAAGPFTAVDTNISGILVSDMAIDADGFFHAVGADSAGAQISYLSNETGEWRSLGLTQTFALRSVTRPRLALTLLGDVRVTYDSFVFALFFMVEDGYIESSIRVPLTASSVEREQTF